VWDLETGTRITMFTCDVEVLCCAFTSVQVIVAGDMAERFRVHSLAPGDSNGNSVPRVLVQSACTAVDQFPVFRFVREINPVTYL